MGIAKMFYSNNTFDGENWNAFYSMKDLRLANPQIFLNFNLGNVFDSWWQGIIFYNYPSTQIYNSPWPQPDKIQSFKDWFKGMYYKALAANIGLDGITGLALPSLYNLMISDSIYRQKASSSVNNEGLWGPLYLEMIPYFDVNFNSIRIVCQKAYNLSKVGIKINGQYYGDIFPGDEITYRCGNIRRIDMIQNGTERPFLDFYFTSAFLQPERKQTINFREAYTGDPANYYMGQLAGSDLAEYRTEFIQNRQIGAIYSAGILTALNLDFFIGTGGAGGAIVFPKGSIVTLFNTPNFTNTININAHSYSDYWPGYTLDSMTAQLFAPGQTSDVLCLIHIPLENTLNTQNLLEYSLFLTDNVYGNKLATRKSRLVLNFKKL